MGAKIGEHVLRPTVRSYCERYIERYTVTRGPFAIIHFARFGSLEELLHNFTYEIPCGWLTAPFDFLSAISPSATCAVDAAAAFGISALKGPYSLRGHLNY